MLYKKSRVVIFEGKTAKFKREHLDLPNIFCCRDHTVCSYYKEEFNIFFSRNDVIRSCVKESLIRGKNSKKAGTITSMYHMCSYLNRIPTRYFYAPEKVIPI